MKLIPIYRVSTIVPIDAVLEVQNRILNILPPLFGNYSGVIWTSGVGEERFIPGVAARPGRGAANEPERVAGNEIVFSLPRDPEVLQRVLKEGLFPAHPWEEPVVFVEELFAVQKSP